jgi:hypothetical protein
VESEVRPHLELILRRTGRARLSGRSKPSPQTVVNLANRPQHAASIRAQAAGAIQRWGEIQGQRGREGRPELPAGVPLLLQIDSDADVDFIRTAFGFEILCEQEDGFLLVASEDVDLAKLEQVLEKFEAKVRGGGNAAKLHSILGQQQRLERVLSPELLERWPRLEPASEYIVDLSIECLGTSELPEPPDRAEDEPDARWQRKRDSHRERCTRVQMQWDSLRDARVAELKALVDHYGGAILVITDAQTGVHSLPDSVSLRVQVSGDGLRDIVQNYQYLFEACLPDNVQQPATSEGVSFDTQRIQPQPPPAEAPHVCVVDSGIQEGHALLRDAIDKEASGCYVPGETSVADEVGPHGHGTRVAGAVLFPNGIPSGEHQHACWIENARILDRRNQLPEKAYPPSTLRTVVQKHARDGTRIFVHSVSTTKPARTGYMSAWAAEIDELCATLDVMVVQAAGNVERTSGLPGTPGVQEHLRNGRHYPDYLHERSSRIANPSQSLHAVTVGSVASAEIADGEWRTLASRDAVSAFSRVGPGMWGCVKPDIVEYGGDFGVNEGASPRVGMPPQLREAYPELVRSTLHGSGPAFDRDECGTSFAAPKAAHIAAQVAAELPAESALLHRALLVHSARWPSWTDELDSHEKMRVLQRIGFGIPDVERATRSSPTRVTLFATGQPRIHAREAHVYQVRVPSSLRSVAKSYRVLVEVTLAYTARPRRTRRTHRGYLSTWVGWKTNKQGESPETFLSWVLKDLDKQRGDKGAVFNWVLGDRSDRGEIEGTSRSLGTVQKDWALVSGDDLPSDFCIAVVGHPGWDTRLEAKVPYALCVTFDVLGEEIDLHADVEV